MSLINEMLKDLETKSKRTALDSATLLTDMRVYASNKFKKNKSAYLVILLLALCVVSLCIFGIMHRRTIHLTLHPNKLSTVAVATPALMTGIALQLQDNVAGLRFMLNKKITYKAYENHKTNQVILLFFNTQLYAALPQIDYQGSGIEKLDAYSDEKKNLKLVIQLSQSAEVKHLHLNEVGKAPELQLDIIYHNAELIESSENIAVAKPGIKKPTAENLAQQNYEFASMLASGNKFDQAIKALQLTLINYPNHIKARELLGTLLIQNKAFAEAEKVLNEGLSLSPNQDSYIELKAKLLAEQGKIKEAIALLETNSPTLVDNPDYHSFIAALYQQNGQSNLAANLYKQLIGLQPTNSKWWLGLGIALESEGNNNQALEAYANAENLGGLNPELQAYIDTRLHNA